MLRENGRDAPPGGREGEGPGEVGGSTERLLNPEISCFLTETRKTGLSFAEKAQRFEEFLRRRGDCSGVVRFDCDVCVGEYLPSGWEHIDILKEALGGRDWGALSEPEKEALVEEVEKALPPECKTRVQAETPTGYLTFCFDCDSTMCMNTVEYPGGSDWDKEHLDTAENFIREHPELNIDSFMLFGSTRRYICIDALVADPGRERDGQDFLLPGGKKVKIMYSTIEEVNLVAREDAPWVLQQYRNLHPR